MKEEKALLDKKLEETIEEYNKLVKDKAELERKNKIKAYEVINQQERNR